MKVSSNPCKIVGVRLGELDINLLSPERARLHAKFVLLRDPTKNENINAGSFTKSGEWSDTTLSLFNQFVESLEQDAVRELFDEVSTQIVGQEGDTTSEGGGLHFPDVPTLGGPAKD